MIKKRPQSKRVQKVAPGEHYAAGGELHQSVNDDHPPLTTNQGLAVSDNQNSLRASPRGPTLLEDFILRAKLPTKHARRPPIPRFGCSSRY